MYEMYGFIAAFTAQIIFFSVLGPLQLVGRLRQEIGRFIEERRPAIDVSAIATVDRKLRLLGSLGVATALIGLVLLFLMIRYMQRTDWTDGPLEVVVPLYFMVQIVPTSLAILVAGRFHGLLKRSLPPAKRKALLEPRRLFDFVPPAAVAVAAMAYVLYLGLLAHIERHPFPGFAGFLVNALMVTLLCGFFAIGVLVTLRRLAASPLQGRDDRMRTAGIVVKACVYAATICVLNLAANMLLILLDKQRWEPAVGCVGLILLGLLMWLGLREQLRIPETHLQKDAAVTL